MAEVTQAERDYVAELFTAYGGHVWASILRQGKRDDVVRAIIDYIRNNPLPEQGK